MEAELIKLYDDNPDIRKIEKIAKVLSDGGLVIYPSDTVYGLGCDITKQKAVERVKQIKGTKGTKTNLSFICHDLSHLSEYTRRVDTPVFKLMKKLLPGPYTFILQSSSKVPKLFNAKKKTVGIRVPDNNILRELVRELGNPIVSTSITDDEDEIIENSTDPELIFEKYQKVVDIVIDGGYGGLTPSTILDCSDGDVEVIREGKGELDF